MPWRHRGRVKRKPGEQLWVLGLADLQKYPDVLTGLVEHHEAVWVLLNLQAARKYDPGIRGWTERNLELGYKSGPLDLNTHQFRRGLFTAICLGLIERADPGCSPHAVPNGEYRRARYHVSYRYREYDFAHHGRFLVECPFIAADWKNFFHPDGRWAVPKNLRRHPPDLPRQNGMKTAQKTEARVARAT
jgi:hypothetical protein